MLRFKHFIRSFGKNRLRGGKRKHINAKNINVYGNYDISNQRSEIQGITSAKSSQQAPYKADGIFQNPNLTPIYILMADQENIDIVQEACKKESLQGRFTYFYDFSKHDISKGDTFSLATNKEQELLNRNGVHYIYKPQLTSNDLVQETSNGKYYGLRIRSKYVPKDVQTYVDIRIGTGIDNFKDRISYKKQLLDKATPYILMNCAGVNALAVAEYSIYMAMHALRRVNFVTNHQHHHIKEEEEGEGEREGSLSQQQQQQQQQESNNEIDDIKQSMIESNDMYNKNITILGMGNIGTLMTKILKKYHTNITCIAYNNPITKKWNFTPQDAKNFNVTWSNSLQDSIKTTDILFIAIPSTTTTKKIINAQLLELFNYQSKLLLLIPVVVL